jgi:hypothetical protein
MHVGILYADMTQDWASFDHVDGLSRDGVLTITLTTERGNRKALVARLWGSDYYALGRIGENYFFTDKWDEGDEMLRIKRLDKPHDTWKPMVRPCRWPDSAKIVRFVGGYVPPEDWQRALQVFEREMF